MNNLTAVLNSGGEKFVEFAVPMLIQSSVLIVILLAVDLLLRKKVRATFRYWLWMLVLVKLVLPPTFSSPVSFGWILGNKISAIRFEQPAAPVTDSAAIVETKAPTEPLIIKPLDTSGEEKASATRAPIPAEAPVTVSAAGAAGETGGDVFSWQAIVLVVWATAAGAMVLLVMQRVLFVLDLIRQAAPAEGLLPQTLEFCRKRMGVNLPIRLKISANATSPAVCGLIRHVILVPQDIGPSLGVGHLRPVLMHELGHIKRGDLWVNMVQTVLQVIYFYNPLLWLANAMIRKVREQAVDEMVQVAMGEKAKDYPETLLSVAKLAFSRPALALRFIGVVESKSQLQVRIKKMLNQPIPKTAKLGIAGLLVIILTGAALLPMATATEDQTIKATENSELTEKKVKELVEDFFKHNYRDITARKTIRWGQPEKDESGNVSIRYNYEATIRGKDKIIEDKVWMFDSHGNFLWVRKAGAEDIYSPAGAQALVENFFANNYRDITARKTIEWGTPEKDANGNVSIRYKYQATIWDKDEILENKIFTFDKNGKYVSVANVEGFPQKLDANDDPSDSAPRIVSASPVSFSNDVSPNLKYIEVTFDQEMMDQSWSWTGGGDTYPKTTGKPRYDESRKKCRLPVDLEPGKSYWVGINSVSYKNFQNKAGIPAPWYVIVFATADAKGKPTPIPDEMLAEARRINARGSAAVEATTEPAGRADVSQNPVGRWEMVDFVKNIDDFNPAQRSWSDDFAFADLRFNRDGSTSGPWTWKTGYLYHPGDKTTAKYVIREIEGDNYLFMECISGDVTIRGQKPWYYVLKKIDSPGRSRRTSGSEKELSNDDGTSAGKWSFAGGGHGVKFAAPAKANLVTAVRICGSRYGEYEPPDENFDVWICDENFNIIENFQFPYSTFEKRGYEKWATLEIEPTKVGQNFAVCVAFDPHQTKGIYVYHDAKGSGHSYQGIPPEMEPFKDGDWLIRAVVQPLPEDEIAAGPEPSPKTAVQKDVLANDDGKSAGKWSFSGGGHGVKFTAPTGGCVLKAVRLYGSRYGESKAPDENFDLWLCDKDFNIIKNFKFPYSTFDKRGYTKWASLKVDDVEVPKEFAICAAFDPHQTKGIYVYYDAESSGHSYQGIPPDMKPFKDGDWMIRAVVEIPAGKTETSPAPSRADKMEAENLAAQAWKLWAERKLPEAEDSFKQAVEKDPTNANAWNGLGWAQHNQGKKENARFSFEKCLEIEPRQAAALNGLGWIAKGENKTDEAIKYWEKAVRVSGGNATASLSGLTQTYMELGKYDEAVKYYRMWLEVEPNNEEVENALAKAQAMQQ